MPQFIDALSTNIQMFRNRYGDLPGLVVPAPCVPPGPHQQAPYQQASPPENAATAQPIGTEPILPATGGFCLEQNTQQPQPRASDLGAAANVRNEPPVNENPFDSQPIEVHPGAPLPKNPDQQNIHRRQSPQDVYDDLKLRDEILSGAYANAVMIGHGPFEFSFDFITNFYPQSAVSSRVYMASGHVLRLLDSLKASWEQIRGRYGHPPKP
jgi:hypothetical protein